MLKKCAFAISALAFAAGANAAAPTAEQVKQALYDHYATAQGSAELKETLEKNVGVGSCEASGDDYRCQVENKALGTSIPTYFRYDASLQKWVFVKEDKN